MTFSIAGQVFEAPALPAGLYVVATPIGNLKDITIRALETLAAVDVIACEDTRTSGIVLARYGIDKPKISYTEHNADARGTDIIRQIQDGRAVALISDAGTPLISDPGQRLVASVVDAGLTVTPLPGPCAPIAALMAAGHGGHGVYFAGFPPTKASARKTWFQAHVAQGANRDAPLVLFESPKRLLASLRSMAEVFGADRRAVVARELTKMHETFHRGTLADLVAEFAALDRIRGEIVVLIEPDTGSENANTDPEPLLREALKSMRTKDAANHVAELTGIAKQSLYAQALALKDEDG